MLLFSMYSSGRDVIRTWVVSVYSRVSVLRLFVGMAPALLPGAVRFASGESPSRILM